MRIGLLGISIATGLVVTACSSTSTAPSHQAGPSSRTTDSARSTPVASASLISQVTDPRCPDAAGVAINTAEWTSRAVSSGDDFPQLAAVMLANGYTLAIASGAPTPETATAVEFKTPCALNPSFGQQGATQLTFPGPGVSIAKVIATADGGAIVAGSTTDFSRWAVGRLAPDGHLDPTFGQSGWVRLQRGYSATALAVTHDGDIIVGGNGNENGSSSLIELTAMGKVVSTFGKSGRVRMPSWHDGGVQGVWIEPNGDILSLVGGGNMGCWGLVAVMLDSTGQRIQGFAANFQRGLQAADPRADNRYPFEAFIGDLTVDTHGFHLVGTNQNGCLFDPPRPNPNQRVSDIAFDLSGRLDTTFGVNGVASFPAPIAAQAWAFPTPNHGALLITNPANNSRYAEPGPAILRLYRLAASGTLDRTYGHRGVVTVPLHYGVNSNAADDGGPVPVSNGRQTAVVASNSPDNAVILIPVPGR